MKPSSAPYSVIQGGLLVSFSLPFPQLTEVVRVYIYQSLFKHTKYASICMSNRLFPQLSRLLFSFSFSFFSLLPQCAHLKASKFVPSQLLFSFLPVRHSFFFQFSTLNKELYAVTLSFRGTGVCAGE